MRERIRKVITQMVDEGGLEVRIVIAPDSYKGSLSAIEVGTIMAKAIRRELPDAEVEIVPMADGGEGTVEALIVAAGGELVPMVGTGPFGDRLEGYYGKLDAEEGGPTAVVEAAAWFALPMVPLERRNPYRTTSRGLGESIRQASDDGFRRVIVGLGGSATNDGGLGLLQALGVRFADAQGKLLEAGFGEDVLRVAAVDWSGVHTRLAECELIVASDVQNPLFGPDGASHVYGPQKGATPEQAASLDEALQRYAALVEASAGRSGLADTPGAGAAGGLGFALLALGAALVPGAEIVERTAGLKRRIAAADWVITGEGRSDRQTLFGKLPYRVAQWAKEAGARPILVSGGFTGDIDPLYDAFDAIFAIVSRPTTLEECLAEAEPNLERSMRSIARLIGRAGPRDC